MKKTSVKLISLLLLCAVALSALASCGIVVSDEYKFGLAILEGDGTQIAAAVIIDSSERIALAKIDEFDEAKEASKKDLGDKYGMVAYGGAKAEWDEQIAHLERTLVGKKIDEVTGITKDDADVSAGCTVYVGNYVAAVAKAAENAKAAEAFKSTEDHLALTLSFAYDKVGANSEPVIVATGFALSRGYIADKASAFCGAIPRACKFGVATVKTDAGKVAAAVVIDADNEIVAAFIDEFDNSKGKSKKELGDAYGMLSDWGSKLAEWDDQITYLENSLVGKNIDQVSTVKKGDADLVGGCTVAVDNYVKAVVKAMNNATGATAFNALVSEVSVKLAFDAEKVGDNYELDVIAEAYASGKKVDEKTIEHSDAEELRFGFAATDAAAMVSAAVVIDSQGRVVAVKIDEFDTSKGQSKKALGDAYGMLSGWGSQLAEWDDQITFLENYFIGKTSADIAPVKKGDADLEGGCTIAVDPYVAAVVSAIAAAEGADSFEAAKTDVTITLTITAAGGATTANATATADELTVGTGSKTSAVA